MKHRLRVTVTVEVDADNALSLKKAIERIKREPPHIDSASVGYDWGGRYFAYSLRSKSKATVRRAKR